VLAATASNQFNQAQQQETNGVGGWVAQAPDLVGRDHHVVGAGGGGIVVGVSHGDDPAGAGAGGVVSTVPPIWVAEQLARTNNADDRETE